MTAAQDDFAGADVWRGSPLFFIPVALGAAAMIVLIIVGWQRMSSVYQVLAPLGALVFLWMLVRAVVNVMHGRNVMLAIGPRGIYDWRIAPAWMPWPDIVKIEPLRPRGTTPRGLRVTMTPVFDASFPENSLSRLLRYSNILTTIRGYAIGLGGLDGSADEITRALDKYHPQWRKAKAIS